MNLTWWWNLGWDDARDGFAPEHDFGYIYTDVTQEQAAAYMEGYNARKQEDQA